VICVQADWTRIHLHHPLVEAPLHKKTWAAMEAALTSATSESRAYTSSVAASAYTQTHIGIISKPSPS
jgi:hypothetical protein